MKTLKPFIFRRKSDDTEGDKWEYFQGIGRDITFTTPFINKAMVFQWHDWIDPRIKGHNWKRFYLKKQSYENRDNAEDN